MSSEHFIYKSSSEYMHWTCKVFLFNTTSVYGKLLAILTLLVTAVVAITI